MKYPDISEYDDTVQLCHDVGTASAKLISRSRHFRGSAIRLLIVPDTFYTPEQLLATGKVKDINEAKAFIVTEGIWAVIAQQWTPDETIHGYRGEYRHIASHWGFIGKRFRRSVELASLIEVAASFLPQV